MDSWSWNVLLDDTIRASVAAVLGGALGLERESKGRWAGLRTHILVSLGCAVFVIASSSVAGENHESVTHSLQGIASGIGFLGAGTILKLTDKLEIKGLTTAGSIWLAAAVGSAAGLAEYPLAVSATCVALFVLGVLGPLESWVQRRNRKKRVKVPGEMRDE